jgi:hypothetical protein
MKASVERANRLGFQVGRTPLGYRKRKDRRLEVDPETSPIVLEVFERRASGVGWAPLTDYLSEATGRPWSRSGTRELIGNDLYKTGRITHGEFVSEHEAGAIVDEALWAAAQRSSAKDPRPSRTAGFYLLSGLARCGVCGHALNPNHAGTRKDGSERHRYVCRNRQCPTPRPQIEARLLERFVTLQSFVVGDELERREAAPDLTELQAAVDQAALRLEWVTTPEAVDALGPGFAATARQYREAHEGALAALGEARQASGVPARSLRLRNVWDGLAPEDRRAALALFWREVRLHRRDADGKRHVTLVARGPGHETELDLGEERT